MLDLNYVLEHLDDVRANLGHRNMHVEIGVLPELAEARARLLTEGDRLRQRANEVAKSMKGKLEQEERQRLIEEGRALKSEIAALDESTKAAKAAVDDLLRQLPNMTHPDAPIGGTEEENREIKRVGEIPVFDFKPLDHVEIGRRLELIDFEAGNKVAGANFYFLKNDAVLLELAMARFALDILASEGFTPHITPDVARPAILDGVGFNPRGEETQIYSIANQDLALIATSEITLGGMMQNEIVDEDELPMLLAGLSHCFRTEAGAHGRASRGLYRVHQFTKIEMFAFTIPEASAGLHEKMRDIEERIFTALEVPFRVVDICTGDLGSPAYRKYDLEAWMPGRGECGEYGEVTSTSNCTDFQARRLNIRYRPAEGKPRFVHTLNGTAIAVSRALIAVLENHQQADGTVRVPKSLVPYMGKEVIGPPKK
ncbi:MAG: serine--tRNA ligase [Candidatus Lernaella stagnicola]|nr:serine--tRNA ligase [Candidatus Lernaella stagnicola]